MACQWASVARVVQDDNALTTEDALVEHYAKWAAEMVGVKHLDARRVLDRLVGYMVSPELSNQAAQRLSAGRVQSLAVRLVVRPINRLAAAAQALGSNPRQAPLPSPSMSPTPMARPAVPA